METLTQAASTPLTIDAPEGVPAPVLPWYKRAWEGWKRFAHVFGVFQTRVVMIVLYGILVVPMGVVARLVSDPLHIRPRQDGNWLPLEQRSHSLDSAHLQY